VKYQYPKPKKTNGLAKRITEAFQSKLNSLISANKLPPSMAVTILANLNMLNLPMPACVFEKLDFSRGFEAPDDAIVVGEASRHIKKGLVEFSETERITVGDFRLQFNQIRGCRPRRIAQAARVPLDLPFYDKKFHFAKSECEPEVFDEITCRNDLSISFLLNRYPFAPYQFIWIPNRFHKLNQFLTPTKDVQILNAACDFVWEDGASNSLRLAYNSLGAHASVNHLHFQGFILTTNWKPPFEKYIRRYLRKCGRSGQIDCYFKAATWISKSDGIKGLKEFIHRMNDYRQPYHFYIHPSGIACFPRKHQADDHYFELLRKSPFTTGFAFFEFLGEIVSPTRNISIFDSLHLEAHIQDLYDALLPS